MEAIERLKKLPFSELEALRQYFHSQLNQPPVPYSRMRSPETDYETKAYYQVCEAIQIKYEALMEV